MKAYIGVDKSKQIRDLYLNGTQKDFATLIAKMGKQVNRRFRRLESAGVESSSYGYKLASSELGKSRPRYSESASKLSKMPKDTLYELAMQLNVKQYSSTTTVRGVKTINDKKIVNAVKALKERGINISEDELKKFLDLGGAEFLNAKTLDSNQIIQDYTEFRETNGSAGKITMERFVDEFKKQKEITSKTPSVVHRNLVKHRENLIKQSNKRKAKRKAKK